ncbi:MAG: T9SS type A sorting domain-containing protein [bacterium]
MSAKKIVFGLLFVFSTQIYAFNSSVVNMVGIPVGSTSTVALPAVVKAESDVVPLFRIDISTNDATPGYTLTAITCTISNSLGFDASVDLLSLSSGLLLYKDTVNSIWGDGSESLVATTPLPASWSGNSPEIVKLTLNSPNTLQNVNYFYICIRTSAGIDDGDQFRAELDNAGEVILGINGANDLQPTLAANGTIMTADTFKPVITAAYNPDADKGTTITVENQDGDNVYATGDTLDLNIYVTEPSGIGNETSANLRGDTNVVALNDCIDISASTILGSLGSGATTFTEIGAGVFNVQFTINDSAVNQNTDGTTPLTFGIKIKDGAGNESSLNTSFKVYIDSKAPDAVTLSAPAAGAYISTHTPCFEWEASDEAHLEAYVLVVGTTTDINETNTNAQGISGDVLKATLPQNGAWFSANVPDKGAGAGNLQSGQLYYWTVFADDLAEHDVDPAGMTLRSFTFDSQPPSVSWDFPVSPGDILSDSTPEICMHIGDYNASLNVATSTIKMWLNDGTNDVAIIPSTIGYNVSMGSWCVTYTPSVPLQDGSYTAKIEVKDKVENVTKDSRAFNIDATSPTVVDSDNDGESDSTEKWMTTDWLDPSSISGFPSFWPKNGEKINYKSLVTDNSSKIMLLIEDVYNTRFSAGPDIDVSTVAISGPAGSFVFGANDSPYPKSDSTGNNDMNPGTGSHIYNRFKCQIPVPLANNGSDDGTYTVTIVPADIAGNIGDTVTRTFIYDTIKPTITAVATPTTATSDSAIVFTIDVTDVNGISTDVNAVLLGIWEDDDPANNEESNMSETSTSGRYTFVVTAGGGADVAYYYFTAEDKAGNIKVYPTNADTDKSQAIKIVVTDAVGPWAVIGNDASNWPVGSIYRNDNVDSNVETLVGISKAGVTVYNTGSAPAITAIPPVYDASNNKLQATVENDAVSAVFQYKVNTSTLWKDITTTVQTSESQVWEATWDTTGLTKNLVYDIRIKATDAAGNTATPSNVNSPAWVKVMLKPAVAPIATIDTTLNDSKVADGGRVQGQLVLCAALKTVAVGTEGVNNDHRSVEFQYRISGGAWTTIATDSDPANDNPTNVTLTLNYDDLPKIIQDENVVIDTSAITMAMFNCTSDAAYNTIMSAASNGWQVTVPFYGTEDYQFYLEFADETGVMVNDPNEQDRTGGGDSQVDIAACTAVWDLSSVSEGTYQVRAVATDSNSNSDSNPAFITVTVDKTAPTSVAITQPQVSDNRLETNSAYTLAAEVNAVDMAVNNQGEVFFLFSDDGGNTWKRINASDSNPDNGWSQAWNTPNLANDDSDYLIKAFGVDEAGNITASSAMTVYLDATDPEVFSFTINGSSATQMELNAGTVYNWTVTTLDSDIDNLELDFPVLPQEFVNWNPQSKLTSFTGSGTTADPYRFSGTLQIAVDPAVNNAIYNLTATLEDDSGRTSNVGSAPGLKVIQVKDVTPSKATVTEVDGLEVRSGDQVTTSDKYIEVSYDLDVNDQGIVYYQYKTAASATWITWNTDNAPATGNSAVFPPESITLSAGDYNLRCLCIDDDLNADPSPASITITVDSSLPPIKQVNITALNQTTARLDAYEYDELIDAVQFEYRAAGDTEWSYLDVGAGPTQYSSVGDRWDTTNLTNLPAGTYEVRAIGSYDTGGGIYADSDESKAAIKTVVIKRNAQGTKTYYLEPEANIFASINSVSFSSTYPGSEQTFTATLAIKSSNTLSSLSNVTARLLLASGVDRYLTVSGSGGEYSATLDISELDTTGSAMVIINATAGGQPVSASQKIGFVASGTAPDLANVGRIVSVDFANGGAGGSNLENESAFAVMPSSEPATPSSQASLIDVIGEPWDFILSEPEALQTSNIVVVTMDYADNEIGSVSESKLGIVWWDSANGKWSSEGITNVSRDIMNNEITFYTNHFSRFAIAEIDCEPAVSFANPVSGGYADSSPIIELDLSDGFSAIREVKVEIDGIDRTANLAVAAAYDGIDNNGNGLIDEAEVMMYYEEPLNQASAISAKYLVRAPLQLTDGSHTLKVTVTNEQGISASSSITFTVGAALDIISAKSYPNPFNPDNKEATLSFTVPDTAGITVKIYDFSGREVFSKNYGSKSGTVTDITWNGRDDGLRLLANGVYFAKIEADAGGKKVSKTLKVAILK